MLAELLCRHGYETMLASQDEKDAMDAIVNYYCKYQEPLELNNFTERGEEVCNSLYRKNMVDIENGTVKLANRDNLKEMIAWFLH